MKRKSTQNLLVVSIFVVFILYMARQWYLPQIYHNGSTHLELIGVVLIAFVIYMAIIKIIPISILSIIIWNYLILALSSHGLLINEVHLAKSEEINKLILPGLCLIASVFVYAATAITTIQQNKNLQILKRQIIIFPFVLAAMQGIRRLLESNEGFSSIFKFVLLVLAILISYLIGKINFSQIWLRLNEKKFAKRLIFAVVGGVAIFYVTGLIQKPIFIIEKNYDVFDFQKIRELNPPAKNVLFLVLDELSPEYVSQILRPIENLNLSIRVETVEALAGSTIDAIPSLLTGELFQGMRYCGFATLCSDNQRIDFSNLRSKESAVDVVGIHHPYCSIKNIRNCYVFSPFQSDPGISFYCELNYFITKFAPKALDALLPTCVIERGYGDAELAKSLKMANQMAFWKEGGSLFMHLPIPHPAIEGIDTGERSTLLSHYEAQVQKGSQVVKLLVERLIDTFGRDFTLVITSDHPLRVNFWCGYHFECNPVPSVKAGIVPFILISPRLQSDTKLPSKQLSIFND